MKLPSLFLCLAIVSATFVGCATQRRINDAPPTAFLDIQGVDRSSKLEHLPFDYSWVTPDLEPQRYSSVLIAPVSTEFLNTEN